MKRLRWARQNIRVVPQKVYTVKGSSRQKRLWGGIADLGGAGIPRCARNDNLKARAVSGYGNTENKLGSSSPALPKKEWVNAVALAGCSGPT